MKNLKIPVWFFVAVLLYAIVRYCRFMHYEIPVVLNSYLTDLLCMPVILYVCLVATRWVKGEQHLRPGLHHVVILTLEFAVLFEVVLPYFSGAYTADWMDVLMYVSGAVFFWQWLHRQKSMSTTTVSNSGV